MDVYFVNRLTVGYQIRYQIFSVYGRMATTDCSDYDTVQEDAFDLD